MTAEYILHAAIEDMRTGRRTAHCYSAHVPGKGYIDRGDDPATAEDYRRQLVRDAESAVENLGYARGYAEPGYQDPKHGILFANWNLFPRGLDTILEKAGYATEWEDEWSTCGDCGKAIRTSANGYDWQPSYVLMNECEIVCTDCIDWPDYLQSIEDNPRVACMAECDPEDYGYRRLSDRNEYVTGFHPGQNDDPRKILKTLQEQGKTGIVFRLSETSQFYSRWEVYQKIEETD